MKQEIDNHWKYIYTWLNKNAPTLREVLNDGISNDKFDKLESLTGYSIPNNFKYLYTIHNGMNTSEMSNLFYGFSFLPIENILKDTELYLSLIDSSERLNDSDKEIDKSYLYSQSRIPFCNASSHCSLCLDLKPTKEGTFGQIIMIDNEYNIALHIASSIEEFLANFANDLKNNKYTLNEEALEDDVEFLEPITEIDINNWHNIEQWKHFDS